MLRFLLEMNMTAVLNTLFTYLPARELCVVAQVSASWNACLLLDSEATTRKKEFLTLQKLDLVGTTIL